MEFTNSIKWLIVIVVLLVVRMVVVVANPIKPTEKPGLHGMLADAFKAKQKNEIEKVLVQMGGMLDAVDMNNLPTTGNPISDMPMYLDRLRTFQNEGRRINYSRCPVDFRKALKELLQTVDQMTRCAENIKTMVDEMLATSSMETKTALQPKLLKSSNEMGQIMSEMDGKLARLDEVLKRYEIDDKKLMERYLAEKEKSGKNTDDRKLFSSSNHANPVYDSSPATSSKDIELIGYMQPVYDGACLRLAKLIEIAGETNKSPEQLKSGAEKTKEFAANYRGSSFPKDFLSVLERIEEQMETFANWQTELQNEEDVSFRNDIDKAHLDEMKQLIRDLNNVASRYGCEISAAP